MENIILNHWQESELIGINSLVKRDGTVLILNCYSANQDNNKLHFAFPICETTVNSLEKFNDDIWTSVEVLTEQTQVEDGSIIVGGEGGMGNEGFLVCIDKENNFLWSLFFNDSNPFLKIEVAKGIIHAHSSSDLEYKVDVHSPEKITIGNFDWRNSSKN